MPSTSRRTVVGPILDDDHSAFQQDLSACVLQGPTSSKRNSRFGVSARSRRTNGRDFHMRSRCRSEFAMTRRSRHARLDTCQSYLVALDETCRVAAAARDLHRTSYSVVVPVGELVGADGMWGTLFRRAIMESGEIWRVVLRCIRDRLRWIVNSLRIWWMKPTSCCAENRRRASVSKIQVASTRSCTDKRLRLRRCGSVASGSSTCGRPSSS